MIEAISWLKNKFGLNIRFHYFNVDDIEYERIDPKDYHDSLRKADVVLLDIRGGDNVYKLTIDALKSSRAKVVVSLVGGSSEYSSR